MDSGFTRLSYKTRFSQVGTERWRVRRELVLIETSYMINTITERAYTSNFSITCIVALVTITLKSRPPGRNPLQSYCNSAEALDPSVLFSLSKVHGINKRSVHRHIERIERINCLRSRRFLNTNFSIPSFVIKPPRVALWEKSI